MQYIVFLIPPAMSIAAALYGYWWLYPVAIATILLPAAVLPAAKQMESVFVFVQTVFSLIPLNIFLSVKTLSFLDRDSLHPLNRLCWLILLFTIFLNIEEILLVFLSRLLWPNQKRIF